LGTIPGTLLIGGLLGAKSKGGRLYDETHSGARGAHVGVLAETQERAQNESNLEKLTAILEDIDDLLFNVEMRVAVGRTHAKNEADTGLLRGSPPVVPSVDSEIENE